MPTLSEITLQHSRDLSALEAECRAQQDEIERARQSALRSVGSAGPALQQYENARAEAATIRDNTVAQAGSAFEAAQIQARDSRSDELNNVQQRYIAADRAVDDVRDTAGKKEDADYQAKLDEIEHTLPLDQQIAAREAASAAHSEALATIEAAWRAACQADRDTQQADLQAALGKERLDGEQAARARDAATTAAGVTFDSAIRLALTALNNALAAVPEAAAITTEFDKRRTAAQQDCHAREDALFAAFHEALKTVTG
jgi:hypothetical protein